MSKYGLPKIVPSSDVGRSKSRQAVHNETGLMVCHPTVWRSAAASASTSLQKRYDLVREAVSWNAVLDGAGWWSYTSGYRTPSLRRGMVGKEIIDGDRPARNSRFCLGDVSAPIDDRRDWRSGPVDTNDLVA